MATLTAVLVAASLGNLNRADAAIAQTSVDRFSSSEQTDPADVTPLESRFCPSHLEATIASIIEGSSFNTAQWGILIEPTSEPTVLYQH